MGMTLVIGGAASGKSGFAEGLVRGARVYLATGAPLDDEMRAKRDRHRAARGPGWRTIEAPMEAAAALRQIRAEEGVLLDCATMWLSNQMMASADLTAAQGDLLAALTACAGDAVVVTNEVGHGIVPADALSRAFREAQGRLNIALAARAERVALVVAGLPLWLKGAP